MEYTEKTVYDEFRHVYAFNNHKLNNEFAAFLNKYYDKVKALSLEEVKSLLPIDFVGDGGTYLEPDWMIQNVNPTKAYPFTLVGKIWDWKGDKSTTDVITSCANNEEDLYRRLLVQYIDYLITPYSNYPVSEKAKEQMRHIESILNK